MARRDAGEVAKELCKIYTAPDADAAQLALLEFADSPWGRKYTQAARVWEDAWSQFIPFLAFRPATRKLLYTTNSIESLNYQLPQGHQGPRPLPRRRRRGQAAVAGHHQHRAPHRDDPPRAHRSRAPPGTDPDQLAFELGAILAGSDIAAVLHDDNTIINRARQAVRARLGGRNDATTS